jgi:hypothetical protein
MKYGFMPNRTHVNYCAFIPPSQRDGAPAEPKGQGGAPGPHALSDVDQPFLQAGHNDPAGLDRGTPEMRTFVFICCTLNPHAGRLRALLEGLAAQQGDDVRWSTLIVDNRSDPPVSVEPSLAAAARVKIIREARPGNGFARLRGFRETTGDVVLLDDDCVLSPDYASQAARFLDDHPEVGAVAGSIVARFETQPPQWLENHLETLGCKPVWPDTLISRWNDPQAPERDYPYFAPYGAGCAVRRVCINEFLTRVDRGEIVPNAGRAGAVGTHNVKPGAGPEDCQFLVEAVLKRGFEVAYLPALTIDHLLPPSRWAVPYLSRMSWRGGFEWARFRTHYGWETRISKPGAWLRAAGYALREPPIGSDRYLRWRRKAGYALGRAA